MRRALLLAFLVGGLILSAASGASSPPAVVKTAFNKELKATIVVDGSGRTLYMLTADFKDKSECRTIDPTCPKLWPLFTTTGKPVAGKGITPSLLGTTKGADGKLQVTYNHHPLYHFHGGAITGPGDKKPGDVRGEGIFSIWYVLSPKGKPIK